MKWMTISALVLATLSPLAQANDAPAYQDCDRHLAYMAGRLGKEYLAQCDKAMAPIVQAAFIKGRNRYYAKQTDAMYSAVLNAQIAAQRDNVVWSSSYNRRSSGERLAQGDAMRAISFIKPSVRHIDEDDKQTDNKNITP